MVPPLPILLNERASFALVFKVRARFAHARIKSVILGAGEAHFYRFQSGKRRACVTLFTSAWLFVQVGSAARAKSQTILGAKDLHRQSEKDLFGNQLIDFDDDSVKKLVIQVVRLLFYFFR